MKGADFARLNEEQARTYLERLRWPHGVQCPKCHLWDVTRLRGRTGLFQCRHCRKQFTVTVGTIFEGSHIPLSKWVAAFHLLCASKKGMSSAQLSRMLGITYKCAWHMTHRIRYAMRAKSFTPLQGVVEADEVFLGGKSRQGRRGRGSERKIPVMAMIQRQGGARTVILKSATTANLLRNLRQYVHEDATIMTDDWRGYRDVEGYFFGGHQKVNHSKREYARGNAHINTAESFFALLKRGIHGSFHHVSRKHLPRYLDEFAFRWEHRGVDDQKRTVAALKLAEGRRLRYRSLVHDEQEAQTV